MNSSSLQRYLHVSSVIIKFIFAALTRVVDPSFQLSYPRNRPHEQGVQPVGARGWGKGGGRGLVNNVLYGEAPSRDPTLYPFISHF